MIELNSTQFLGIVTLALTIAVTLAQGILKGIEFFITRRMAKNGDGPEGYAKQILEQLRLQNNNHLHTIEEKIQDGDNKIVKAIEVGNMQFQRMNELLIRLDEHLRK